MEPQETPEIPTPPQPSTTITPTAPSEVAQTGQTETQQAQEVSQTAPQQPQTAPESAQPSTAAEPKADPKERVSNILPVTEPGERTICVIKRHRVGIMSIYAMCALVTIITAVLAFLVVPALSDSGASDRGQTLVISALVFLVVGIICVAFAAISAKIYRGNSWTVTTDSLTQVKQFGLFSRQSSQLSLKDLEDVTAEQNGVLAEMFNYGLLKVETAGERSKFVFPFCPNPNYYAQQILKARETFERNRAAEENSYQEAEPPQVQAVRQTGPATAIQSAVGYDTEGTP